MRLRQQESARRSVEAEAIAAWNTRPTDPALAETVARLQWQPMETAPRTGEILLWLGETWPDYVDARVGSYVDGDWAEQQDYREFAKYGAWMIVHSRGEDWYLIDVTEPLGWSPLPSVPGFNALPALLDAVEGKPKAAPERAPAKD